jgi:hypothetical protein
MLGTLHTFGPLGREWRLANNAGATKDTVARALHVDMHQAQLVDAVDVRPHTTFCARV